MPITDEQIAIVKSTVPILRTGGEALTTHFYKIMFRDHPSVRALFNQTHQSSGAQPRALANSVLAYAENIDALQNLGPVAAQIVAKHVALQVLPEHYPIVGGCLLQAIREVLGPETATDEVIAAWGAAYGQLADILIGAEAKAYKEIAETTGGWAGAREFIVAKKHAEADGIVSFHLRPADGKAVIAYKPGQYIGLQLFAGTPQEARRNYSLSQAADGASLRITVKKEAGGVVSTHLHEAVKEGDTLNVFPPSGNFVLAAPSSPASPRPTVLISGGVGITPTIAMLQALSQQQEQQPSDVRFVHFSRSAAVHPFKADVEAIVAKNPAAFSHHFFYTRGADALADAATARPADEDVANYDFARFDQWLPTGEASASGAGADVDVYLLGPSAFMRRMRKGLIARGVPEAQIAFEFFGPTEAMA